MLPGSFTAESDILASVSAVTSVSSAEPPTIFIKNSIS
jgi:hypothetical protein